MESLIVEEQGQRFFIPVHIVTKDIKVRSSLINTWLSRSLAAASICGQRIDDLASCTGKSKTKSLVCGA